MSKIGKVPIIIPEGVQVEIFDGVVTAHGPLGQESRKTTDEVVVTVKEDKVFVSLKEGSVNNAFWGLERALISNIVMGVKEGFTKKLEMVGVGFRTRVEGNTLVLLAGYSHPVKMVIPDGLKVTVTDDTKIQVTGTDRQKVGQFSALVRKVRKPEPYKGKGIKYSGEVVRRKAGKAGKAGASAK
ncbi:50S ribosomal protein L6 [candidate division WWE3 bacterium CG08_land_8_20_14_0_20_40_13]|uniref:Large ribosomal subunit protein uL6 n=1 Tax=candidate division WWE3 bacterium CG08_land_8_20_14_0_20_40_13 TaxID=1975084 RepID=A0A2H0XEK7_UNCKA|nr:MAG: 50S ribosomal protein L6 [candidate division WWE3 bacterium CG08_land_8_20_14_0_20_40_13]